MDLNVSDSRTTNTTLAKKYSDVSSPRVLPLSQNTTRTISTCPGAACRSSSPTTRTRSLLRWTRSRATLCSTPRTCLCSGSPPSSRPRISLRVNDALLTVQVQQQRNSGRHTSVPAAAGGQRALRQHVAADPNCDSARSSAVDQRQRCGGCRRRFCASERPAGNSQVREHRQTRHQLLNETF